MFKLHSFSQRAPNCISFKSLESWVHFRMGQWFLLPGAAQEPWPCPRLHPQPSPFTCSGHTTSGPGVCAPLSRKLCPQMSTWLFLWHPGPNLCVTASKGPPGCQVQSGSLSVHLSCNFLACSPHPVCSMSPRTWSVL